MKNCFIPTSKILTRNAIDLNRFQMVDETNDKNVLFLADVNHKKGISLFVQIAIEMSDYKFYVAGNIQEKRFGDYLHHIKPKNVFYIGYQDNIQNLMEGKRFILCTSPAEGNPNNIIEGMCCGLKPVIHRYLGYSGQFPEECCYTSIKDARFVFEGYHDPKSYRKYVEDNYDMNKVYSELEELCQTSSLAMVR
jgi:hypothetical protein